MKSEPLYVSGFTALVCLHVNRSTEARPPVKENPRASPWAAEPPPLFLFSLQAQDAEDEKEALVVRFLTKRFIWEYDPTLESTYRHQANIDDETVSMEILDTAGQEDVLQKEGHMRWGDGFILVYDITDRGSFEDVVPLKGLLDEVKRPKHVPLVLLGNKADLEHARQVATEEGERLAADMACAFYECSACADQVGTGGGVAEAFHELCREIRRRRAVQGKTRRRSSTTHVKQAINKMLTKISS
ncbi:ras-related and estrogen-regulated growth inhibitor [Labeo rohita]|nr:ras-related and estrogen-regulated growth inhibitor [Labeo rohita]